MYDGLERAVMAAFCVVLVMFAILIGIICYGFIYEHRTGTPFVQPPSRSCK